MKSPIPADVHDRVMATETHEIRRFCLCRRFVRKSSRYFAVTPQQSDYSQRWEDHATESRQGQSVQQKRSLGQQFALFLRRHINHPLVQKTDVDALQGLSLGELFAALLQADSVIHNTHKQERKEYRKIHSWERPKLCGEARHMKRRGKILLLGSCILGIALVCVVCIKIVQRNAEPFSGAVVVLDDPMWLSRATNELVSGYLWSTPDTVVYQKSVPGGSRIVRQIVHPGSKNPPPEILLTLFLKSNQFLSELSQDGKMLCIFEITNASDWEQTLISLDGSSKPVALRPTPFSYCWFPDGRSFVAVENNVFYHGDRKTGKVTQHPLTEPQTFELTQITLDGRMLSLTDGSGYAASLARTDEIWTLSELKNERIVVLKTLHKPKSDSGGSGTPMLSPTGDRLLWKSYDQSKSLFAAFQRRFLKRTSESYETHWKVTDLDGKNVRHLGTIVYSESTQYTDEMEPMWTPDGKGVHFVKDKKLYYLAVP